MRLVTHWKHARALPSGRLFHASVEDEHGLLRCDRLEPPMSELGCSRTLPRCNSKVRFTLISRHTKVCFQSRQKSRNRFGAISV